MKSLKTGSESNLPDLEVVETLERERVGFQDLTLNHTEALGRPGAGQGFRDSPNQGLTFALCKREFPKTSCRTWENKFIS